MKAIIFFIFFTIVTIPTVFGQIKIGDNPQNIDASSVLELESTSKVLVITRVTTLEMEAITPRRGGMVYNTDTECINYYDGTQWVNLCDAVNFEITNDPIFNGRSTIEITESAGGYNLEVAKNSILGDNIVDGGIGPDDIQDNSITQDKLAAESVGSSEIRQNAVGSEEIRDGSIAPSDIANFIPGQVLTTDENGIVQWEDSNDLFDLTFSKLDTTLTISRSTTAGVSTISLGALIGSDDQQLSLVNNILSLENDEVDIDLSTYLQTLSINPAGNEISLTNGGSITLPQINGSETKVNQGNNITVTGDGTTASPYIINAADAIIPNGSETIVTEGNNITVTGNGTTATPYVINAADAIVPNGSETIVTEGNNITVTGNGTTATPYIINAADGAVADGTETILQNGDNITITGDGSNGDPYIINASDVIDLNQGNILIGNNANVAVQGFISGDATMNDLGELTIEEAAISPLKIEPALGVLTEDQVLITTIAGDVEWANFPPGGGGGTDNQDASEVPYDPTVSGLTATTTQAAIDELAGSGLVDTDEQDASEVPYDGTASGLTATTTQAAIDELAGITEIDGIIGNEVTAATDATLELSGTGTTADPLTLDVAALGIDTDELAAGAVTLPKMADGTAAGQLLQWDGTEWVYIQEADITATVTEIDGIIGNEVTAATDATLELSGTGTTADPLTLDVAALGIDTDELA
ncbi:beta strand repeat-containing protein, partial [Maribacter spongiicola]|uniref:beta strand repeat-containing protein n=1 Tax=Maribacter spongiicola TaxID=1206753 RepID=UPI003F9CC065